MNVSVKVENYAGCKHYETSAKLLLLQLANIRGFSH